MMTDFMMSFVHSYQQTKYDFTFLHLTIR